MQSPAKYQDPAHDAELHRTALVACRRQSDSQAVDGDARAKARLKQ